MYLPFHERDNSMEKSPSWEDDKFSASQAISHILWKPEVCYSFYKMSPPLLVLSQISPVRAHPFHFLKIHFVIIHSSTPRSSKCFPSLRFSRQNSTHLSSSPYVPHAPPISFFFIWSPEYLLGNTELKASHYAVFSIPLFSRHKDIMPNIYYLLHVRL